MAKLTGYLCQRFALLLEPYDFFLMNVASPHDPNLNDVMAFNETLLKLVEAGVPIGLGPESESVPLVDRLSAINAKIAMDVARGSTVRQFLDSDQEIPSLYRSSLRTWLYCDHSPEALKALCDDGDSRRNIERILSFSLLQPLILLVLVYFGFLYLLLGLAPKLLSISQQIGSTGGFGLNCLLQARQYMPLWAVLGPVVIALCLLAWHRHKSKWYMSCLPGQRAIFETIRKANYADAVSNLLEHEYAEEQAIASVGALNRGAKLDVKQAALPPLLRWALGDDVIREDRIESLHFSARGYREIALKRAGQWRSWFPVLVGSLFGGAIVLAFGLSLFGPMVELLIAITRP